MFEAYDMAKVGKLPFSCLVQALKIAGVEDPLGALREDFEDLGPESYLSKSKFTQIMLKEFEKNGYSF